MRYMARYLRQNLLNNPETFTDDLLQQRNGYLPFTLDTYGCHSVLLNKRIQRNPYLRFHPYYTSSPELAALLDWCPGNTEGGTDVLFEGPLPWDRLTIARDS